MRGFMSTKRSLADARIAYTLLSALTVVLAVSMLIGAGFREKYETLRRDLTESALTECADSLEAIRNIDARAGGDEARLAQILRFEQAFEGLELTDELALALRRTAVGLRAGESADTKLIQTFARLAAMRTGGDTVNDELEKLFAKPETPAPSGSAMRRTSGVNGRFALACAGRRLEALLPGAANSVKLKHESEYIGADAENLRLRFSDFDGSPRELVYIRLGEHVSEYLSDRELDKAAKTLALDEDKDFRLVRTERLGSFRLYGFEREGKDAIRLILDCEGRLWAMMRDE